MVLKFETVYTFDSPPWIDAAELHASRRFSIDIETVDTAMQTQPMHGPLGEKESQTDEIDYKVWTV